MRMTEVLSVADLEHKPVAGPKSPADKRSFSCIRVCWFNRVPIEDVPDVGALTRIKAGYGRERFSVYFGDAGIFVAQWVSGQQRWFRTSLDRDVVSAAD